MNTRLLPEGDGRMALGAFLSFARELYGDPLAADGTRVIDAQGRGCQPQAPAEGSRQTLTELRIVPSARGPFIYVGDLRA